MVLKEIQRYDVHQKAKEKGENLEISMSLKQELSKEDDIAKNKEGIYKNQRKYLKYQYLLLEYILKIKENNFKRVYNIFVDRIREEKIF